MFFFHAFIVVLRVSVNFDSCNNYRSGVYIGLTCAGDEFNNVFVTVFGCPMQSGLKSKQSNQTLVFVKRIGWHDFLVPCPDASSWHKFLIIANVIFPIDRGHDFLPLCSRWWSSEQFRGAHHAVCDVGIALKISVELSSSDLHAHRRFKSRFDAAQRTRLCQSWMAYAPLWDPTHVTCSVGMSIAYFQVLN